MNSTDRSLARKGGEDATDRSSVKSEARRRVSAAAGVLVGLGATAVLVGWIRNWPLFEDAASPIPRVVPLTATGFLGLSLVLIAGSYAVGRNRRQGFSQGHSTAMALGAIWSMAIGALRTAADLFGWKVSLDAFPLQNILEPGALEGLRMAPATALNLVTLGGAALLAGRERWKVMTCQLCVLTALLLCYLSMGRILFGGEPLVPLAQMSVPTTTLFFISGIGILFLWPDTGLVRLLRAPTAGGILMRYLLVPILVVPPFMGWLGLQGERAGLYDRGASISLFTVSSVVIFGILVCVAAGWLDRADLDRLRAERKTLKQLERLQLLHHITRATAERQDPASIFQVAVRSIEEHLPADFACVCLHDRVANDLQVVAIGVQGHEMAGELGLDERSTFPADQNGLDRSLGGLLVYESDLRLIDRPFARRLAAAGLRSLVLAPLQVESRIFGLLVAARQAENGFVSGECEFLRQLGESVALASSQAELSSALQNAYVDLQNTQRAVVQQERLRALGEMASGIAHDINNSISPAAMFAELLLERERNLSAEGRVQLEVVRRAVLDVAQTTSRMQELYRRRAPDQALSPIYLNPLIEQVLNLTRSRWRDIPQERGISIEVQIQLQDQLPLVRGVESEIREMLTNLVFNAVDAMPAGGLLTLRTHVIREERVLAPEVPAPELVVLEVTDSGTGMDEETRRRCLEPFFTTKGDRGSGLGLPMVFSVAERHEADVEIDSEVGRGTTVRLVFPAVSIELPPSEGIGSTHFEKLRILVVDDDPILLETLNDVLANDGHWVTAEKGGKAGLLAFETAQAQGRTFDLVFTDLGMPEIDGRRVAAGIKELAPETPVVLLTGWGHRMVSDGELPAHVDLILNKPPRLKELRETVRRFQ